MRSNKELLRPTDRPTDLPSIEAIFSLCESSFQFLRRPHIHDKIPFLERRKANENLSTIRGMTGTLNRLVYRLGELSCI